MNPSPFSDSPPLLEHVRSLIRLAGDDPSREGLARTPERYLKAFEYLTHGYHVSIHNLLNGALFDAPSSNMVIVKNIEFYSLCEHHLLPFFGKCHVGYIPDKKIIGLSKVPRIVDAFSRRLQVQERLTSEIATCLMEMLRPLGVGVVMEASHLCMMMRGVEKQNPNTQTSSLLGEFQALGTRSEFFNLIK